MKERYFWLKIVVLSKILSYLAHQHQITSRNLLILFSILIVSFLFGDRKFQFEFDEGKLWRYETLYAPFSFPIQKSSGEIEAQRLDVQSNFIPYYNLDEMAKELALREYIAKISEIHATNRYAQSKSPSTEKKYIEAGSTILSHLYSKGIVQIEENEWGSAFPENFYLLHKNEARLHKFSEFYSVRDALKMLLYEADNYPALDKDILLYALQSGIKPTITYNKNTSEKLLQDALNNILPNKGVVQEGELIIQQNSLITEDKYKVLHSMKMAYENNQKPGHQRWLSNLGYLMINTLIFILFYLFLRSYQQEIVQSNRKFGFVILSILSLVMMAKIMAGYDKAYLLYAIPFCLQIILVYNFFGIRVAWMTYTTSLLLISLFLPLEYDFIIMQFLAGLISVVVGHKTYYGKQFFISSSFIFIVYLICWMSFTFMESGSLSGLKWNLGFALLFSTFFTLLAYPLIPLMERSFGFISNLSLIEISDLNKPLLKDLARKAPGTFWHSLQVASLAESVADEIGANALLVKVGALYHDIGKIENPGWFTENQKGEVNPHDGISPRESAALIISHITKGIELAKTHKIPGTVIDFIRTHHGTTILKIFLMKEEERNPGEKIDLRYFTYPGPLPFSRETALLMMADSLEAASHSLQNPEEKEINRLVDEVIDSKIRQNQFDRSDLTFKDLQRAKVTFKKLLSSKFHTRISYPSEVNTSNGEG